MFTGVIKLAQIDDYIAPSQNCIQPKIMKQDPTAEKATISLNDCLACSGCITSAESILIEQMSVKKLIQAAQKQKCIILCFSPQSILALCQFYRVEPDILMHRVKSVLLKEFKSDIQVFSLQEGIQLSHLFIYEEYREKVDKEGGTILCSQCPGWICYAEKTLNQTVTSLISKVKSPQQIMGRLLKQKYGKQTMVVSIMPCYDKKLEAIRFQIQQKVKEVDLTISTTELIDLFTQISPNFTYVQPITEPFFFNSLSNEKQNMEFLKDQTSNGYIEHLIQMLKIQAFERREVRNVDFIEYEWKNEEGKVVKMAKCYGFRNIQKIVQQIKKKKCQYDYVEIMACPGGCFSGGGQPKYEQLKPKQTAAKLQEIAQKYLKISQTNSLQFNYAKDKFVTQYKPIQKSLNQVVMNW